MNWKTLIKYYFRGLFAVVAYFIFEVAVGGFYGEVGLFLLTYLLLAPAAVALILGGALIFNFLSFIFSK